MPTQTTPAPRGWPYLASILALALALRLAMFIGFTGSDDITYSLRGLMASLGQWPETSYIGALRLGMTLPVAGLITLFGASAGTVSLWGLLSSLGEIALVFLFMARSFGLRAGVFAALMLSVMPLHINLATSLWADPPYALMLTTSILALWHALRGGGTAALVISGLACGFAGWIKPEPTAVFGLVLCGLALFHLPRYRQLLWLLLGVVLATIPNLLVFQWAYGDALYYLNAGRRNIETNFVQNASPWGDHSAGYYLRLMFRDGRAFWLVPLLAIPGLAVALRERANPRAGRFLALWAVALIGAFSLFIYSVSPLRLIPKQVNYALMFAAPIAALAGLGLARLSLRLAIPVFLVVAAGGITLAGIEAHTRLLHGEANGNVLGFARTHPDALVLGGTQAANLNEWDRLAGKPYAHNLVKIDDFQHKPELLGKAGQIYVTDHPAWPEYSGTPPAPLNAAMQPCLSAVDEMYGTGTPVTRGIVAAVARLRKHLPAAIDRQVSFTDQAIKPAPLRIRLLDQSCAARVGNTDDRPPR
ncbi:MAG: glycosyltransferase family 39 protein [Proteobacteria bacterium]|nr:glycosyltransferase family 39 protein [Pseudomonadota bacterium]